MFFSVLEKNKSLPVTAVLVETSKAGPTLNLPKVALHERLKDTTTETFDDELDKFFLLTSLHLRNRMMMTWWVKDTV